MKSQNNSYITSPLLNWIIDHSNNYFIMGLITFSNPEKFIRSIYKNNINKEKIWKNEKACLTISFDCDYPEDIEAFPDVLKILNKYDIRASFALVGYWIEKYLSAHKTIVDAGHEIVNHTYTHPDNDILTPNRKFRLISYKEKKEEVEKCHEICSKLLNVEPIGFRIPHFKHLFTREIYKILKDLNYIYSSSTWLTNTKTAGNPYLEENNIWEFPLSVCPAHPFTVFDTWHSLNTKRLSHRIKHRTEKQYFELLKKLIDIGIETKSYINLYLDPLDIHRLNDLEKIFNYLKERKDDLSLLTYDEILKKQGVKI